MIEIFRIHSGINFSQISQVSILDYFILNLILKVTNQILKEQKLQLNWFMIIKINVKVLIKDLTV